MTTLTEFLEARIAEDEATALAVEDNSAPWNGQWKNDEGHAIRTENGWVLTYAREGRPFAPGFLDHVARHDPARVLRDVAAKRKLVADFKIELEDAERYEDVDSAATSLRLLGILATVYSDHPDYQKEWVLGTRTPQS